MCFFDCLKREIKVGDVITYAHRTHNNAELSLAIVHGFTEEYILVTVLERGNYYGRKQVWVKSENGDIFRFMDGRRYGYGYRAFITGLTEQELYRLITPTTGGKK